MKAFLLGLLSILTNFNSHPYLTCPLSKCKPPQDIIISKNKILVIGDLHADYTKTVNLLKYFNLIDNNNTWLK